MENAYVTVQFQMSKQIYDQLHEFSRLYPDMTLSGIVERAIAVHILKDAKAPVTIPSELFSQLIEMCHWVAFPTSDPESNRYRTERAYHVFDWTAEYDCMPTLRGELK